MYPSEVRTTKTKIPSMPVYTRASHRISFSGIYRVYIQQEEENQEKDENEEVGNWNTHQYICICHRTIAGGAWRFEEGRLHWCITDRFGSLLIIHLTIGATSIIQLLKMTHANQTHASIFIFILIITVRFISFTQYPYYTPISYSLERYIYTLYVLTSVLTLCKPASSQICMYIQEETCVT